MEWHSCTLVTLRPVDAYLQRLGRVRVGVVVQDDIVGHVEAFPHAQVVKQRRLTKHIAHVHDGDVWNKRAAGDYKRKPNFFLATQQPATTTVESKKWCCTSSDY